MAHRAPEKAAVAWELEHRWPSSLRRSLTARERSSAAGEPELRGEVPEAKLPLAARDKEHLRTLRTLGLESYLVAPLQARGRTLGAITFAYTGSHRSYRKADLRLAMELAAPGPLAMDNALLYRASQEAVRLRDEFLAVASHELKTPLTPLNLRLQTPPARAGAEETPVNPARLSEHVAALQRQSKRLSTLAESLLDVSRLEAGRLVLDLEYVDLSALARDVVGRFAAQAARTGTPLEVLAREPVVGIWDRVRLEQVVSSLLSNALKYGAGRPVHVLRGAGAPGARASPCGTRALASPQSTCRASSIASSERCPRSTSAGWGWGCTSPGTWWMRSAAASAPPACRATEPPSRWTCRSPHPRREAGGAADSKHKALKRDPVPSQPPRSRRKPRVLRAHWAGSWQLLG